MLWAAFETERLFSLVQKSSSQNMEFFSVIFLYFALVYPVVLNKRAASLLNFENFPYLQTLIRYLLNYCFL